MGSSSERLAASRRDPGIGLRGDLVKSRKACPFGRLRAGSEPDQGTAKIKTIFPVGRYFSLQPLRPWRDQLNFNSFVIRFNIIAYQVKKFQPTMADQPILADIDLHLI